MPTEGWPGWVGLGSWVHSEVVYLAVTHPAANQAQHRVTLLIKTKALPLIQTANQPRTLFFACCVSVVNGCCYCFVVMRLKCYAVAVITSDWWQRIVLLSVFTAPKISDLSVTSCVVDWTPLKPLGSDSLVYILQLQHISSRDLDYHEASCNLELDVTVHFYYRCACVKTNYKS